MWAETHRHTCPLTEDGQCVMPVGQTDWHTCEVAKKARNERFDELQKVKVSLDRLPRSRLFPMHFRCVMETSLVPDFVSRHLV